MKDKIKKMKQDKTMDEMRKKAPMKKIRKSKKPC